MRDLDDNDLNNPILEKDNLAGQGGGLLTSVGDEISNSIRGLDAGVGAVEAMDTPPPDEEEQKAEELAEDNGEVADEEVREELAAGGTRADEGTEVTDGESAQTYAGLGSTGSATSQAPVQLASYAGISGTSKPIWESAAQEDTRPESFQTVEDGYYGPPPPHDFDQSGCGCACCADGANAYGSGGVDSGAVAAPAAATTIDNLARYLSEYNHANTASNDFWDDFWGVGPNFHWNLATTGTNAQSGTITFNLGANNYDSDGLDDDGTDTASRKAAIRNAFDIYEDVLGINFVETTSMNADINFGNENAGRAFANFNYSSDGSIQNAWINIAKDWSGNGTIGDYYFHTALHEIAHTLGLGHQGNYNAGQGSNTYANQAQWENDTIQFSMMSYWAQANYTPPGNGTPSGALLGDVNVIGPQIVDWAALDRMYDPFGYGINDGATTGNTTWGFNDTWGTSNAPPVSNTLNNAFNSLWSLLDTNTLTIVDGGGNDTLDLSGFSNNSKIDLRLNTLSTVTPYFSDVAGLTGNLTTAVGTVIENAVGGSGSEEIYGNSSANSLNGNGGNDTIIGYGGNDTLIGGSGADSMNAGDGNDTFRFFAGTHSSDTLIGGSGEDRLLLSGLGTFNFNSSSLYFNSIEEIEFHADVSGTKTANFTIQEFDSTFEIPADLHIDSSGGNVDILNFFATGSLFSTTSWSGWTFQDWDDTLDQINITLGGALTNFTGTIRRDNIQGASANETINGHSDNDIIDGNAGNDSIDGGSGNDTLLGGDGNDTLEGGSGSDSINGGNGDDLILINPGWTGGDTNIGGAGTDTFMLGFTTTGAYSVNLATGVFNGGGDTTSTLASIENVTTSNGNDTLIGNTSANVLTGLSGNDSIDGGSGNDTLLGGDGNDTINDGSGSDSIEGGAGDDLFLAGDTSFTGDSWNGGAGNDTISYQNHNWFTPLSVVEINLATALASYNGFTEALTSIENVIGSNGDESIVGSAGANRLEGLGGADTIEGGDGGDTLLGGGGNDLLYGGAAGDDSGTGIDSIRGGAGNDTINGGDFFDRIFGDDGDDLILHTGGGWHDHVDGGAGNDTVDASGVTFVAGATFDLAAGTWDWAGSSTTLTNVENVIGTNWNDSIIGSSGANWLAGGAGNDSLSGGAGIDTLLGGAGDDTLDGGSDGDSLDGGDGNDIIRGGSGSFGDTLLGGAGDDTLIGGSGVDSVDAGDGNDVIENNGGEFIDDIDGGAGIDTLDMSGYVFNFLTANLGAGTYTVGGGAGTQILINVENVIGMNSNDIISGSSGANRLEGNNGNDTILGGGGGDTILGGDGNDVILGGFGIDSMDGGAGVDTVDFSHTASGGVFDLGAGTAAFGGASETMTNFENLIGTSGNDSISGTSGANRLEGNNGNDTILGGDGNDVILGGFGIDSMDGGAGVDTVDFSHTPSGGVFDLGAGTANFSGVSETMTNFENLIGTSGNDSISGTSGANRLEGNNGNDTILGGGGGDTILGGDGNDVILGGFGIDSMDGGAGVDTVDFSHTASGGVFDLGAGTAAFGGASETMTNFENLIGTSGNDSISGTSGANRLEGNNGNDTILGGDGNDVILGGFGIDSMDGGAGVDTVDFSHTPSGGVFDLGAGTANFSGVSETMTNFENLIGTSGNDSISGTSGANRLEGNNGNDTILGGGGGDTILGGDGNDVILGGFGIDSMDGGAGVDTVDFSHTASGGVFDLGAGTAAFGGASETMTNFENLIGTSGNDSISGTSGANRLEGNNGNDTILGGDGNDVILGGFGIDSMDGGAGVDTVDFSHTPSGGVFDLGAGTANFSGVSETMTNFENLIGTSGNDSISGTSGANRLEGNNGNDTILGGGGGDTILGGDGNDVFAFEDGFGQDVITDFNSHNSEDIDLSGVTNITDFTDLLNNHLVNSAGTAQIVDGANSILLQGVAFSAIGVGLVYSADDFIF
ncbi:M10 family metallopeptidase C-terminal domain-containing protein (plasmid) [Shimia sp. W99]